MGRPPKQGEAFLSPITVRFPRPMMEAIEAIMVDRMDQPDKGQVIRELVAEALAARGSPRRKR